MQQQEENCGSCSAYSVLLPSVYDNIRSVTTDIRPVETNSDRSIFQVYTDLNHQEECKLGVDSNTSISESNLIILLFDFYQFFTRYERLTATAQPMVTQCK